MANNRISVLIDVTVDKANRALSGFRKSVGDADGAVGKFKAGAKSAGDSLKANIVPVAAAAGVALVTFAAKSVKAASNLEESINAVNKTFGEAADGVLALGENADESMGLSQSAFNQAAVSFSSFAKQVAGPGGDVAAVIGDLTGRAADFASVMNLDVAEAATVFRSGLSGETEPLKRFGIDLSAASVEAHALAMGLVESKSEMTEAIKVQARYSLLMSRTNDVAGDFADTSDGLANSTRIAQARIENFEARVGEELIPTVATAVNVALDMADAMEKIGISAGGVNEKLDENRGFWGDVANAAENAINPVRLAGQLYNEAGDRIEDAFGDDNAAAAERMTSIIGGAVDPTEKYAEATEEAADAADDLEQQHKDNVAALEEIVDAQEAARQATEDARMATLESLDASLNYRNQLADTAAEMANVVEVTNDAESSAEDIAQAHRDAEGAAMAQADAAVELARSQAEMEGATLTAGQELLIYRDELAKLKDSATGDVAIAIQMMIDEIDRMRTDVDSEGIGTAIGQGVAWGISAQAGAITASLGDAIREAQNATRTQWKIESPSKIFAKTIGEPIAQGVAEGIEADADKIGDALEKAIRDATEDAIDAAQDLVDAANDTLDGLWGGIDDDRSLEDMADSVAEAQANLAKVMADGESSTDDIARAQERLEDASYRLLKATQDNIAGTDEERQAWIELAAQAGLTVEEIDKLVDAYHRLAKARAEAAKQEAAINAEAANAQRIRTDFGKFVSEGLVRPDQVTSVGDLSSTPGAQIALMEKIMLAIIANFPKKHSGGMVPGMPGSNVPIMAQAGERVMSRSESMAAGMSAADMERAVANGMIAGWKRVQQMTRAV